MSEMELRDAILRHSLQLLRLSAGQQAEVETILRDLEAELKALLNSNVLSEAGKAEIRALIGQAEEIIHPTYAKIAATTDTHALAIVVAEKTVAAIEDVLPVNVLSPSAERLASLTKDVLIDGAPSSAWWDREAEDTAFKFAAQLRQGVINGETNERIVGRILGRGAEPGIIQVSHRNARALVHSSVMAAANDARLAVYRKNGRLIAGVRWLSTLDSHVCWTAETLILMADGSEKPIAEVREGEFVIGGVTGEAKRVIATMKNLAQSSVVVHCDGRYVGTATEDHPILTPSGWREVGSVALSADVREREVLCRRHEAAERPLPRASEARHSELAPCGEPSMAEARPAEHEDHRQSHELRDSFCDGSRADRAPENEGSARLQYDGWRGFVGRGHAKRSMAVEGGGEQSTPSSRSGSTRTAPPSNNAELERPGLSREGERSARSKTSATARRSGLEGQAGGEVRRDDAPQMDRPGISGEDGRAASGHPFAGISGAGGGEAAGDDDAGAAFGFGQEVLGHAESVTIGILTGERVIRPPVEVYNLTVEEDHTYVAGGVIAHNCVQCAALDGQAWDLDGGKLTGTEIDFTAPPAHWNCRCVLSPIPKSLAEFGIEMPEGTRASAAGPVSATTTFADFLHRQPEPFVEEVLGKRRAAMFLAGKLTLRDLISGTGRELTLEQIGI